MKATTHALVGGLAGALVGTPVWAFVAGVVSHAALDMLPHRDDDRLPHVIVDGSAALAVLALAVITGHISLAAGVIGGVIPDLENVPAVLFKRKGRKVFPSHWWEHERAVRGDRVEVVVFLGAVLGLAIVLSRTGLRGMIK